MEQPIETASIAVGDLTFRFLVSGAGPPVVLLHGDGDSKVSWSWVLPTLARTHRVYALDLPGFASAPLADYSPARFARLVAAFLDALGIARAAVVGNSFGGLIALRLALAAPARVAALGLVDSAGLGQAMVPLAASLAWPGYGEYALAWGRTPHGAAQRAWLSSALLFADPARIPAAWVDEQKRLARQPAFAAATLAALRAIATPAGQRDVLLWHLSRLTMPTLVLWGANDLVFPAWQACAAAAQLRRGQLGIVPACGHLPHVERPAETARALAGFLARHEARRETAISGAR